MTYKTAWFLLHRIREAMRSGELYPCGSGRETMEADETFIGQDSEKGCELRGFRHQIKVPSPVGRPKAE